jgi:N-acetylmuramoyl-L-alanine amidase
MLRERRRRRFRRALALSVPPLLAAGLAVGWLLVGRHAPDHSAQTSPSTSRVVRSAPPPSTIEALPTTTPTRAVPAAVLTGVEGRVVAIDPGHDGGNSAHLQEINRSVDAGTLRKPCDVVGTTTASGYSEAGYNLDVALRLAAILRRAGATVVLTRETNVGWGPCITERAAIGNRAHADVALSIHADGGPQSGRGFHVIYPPSIRGLTDDIASQSRRLALMLRSAFASGTGMPTSNYAGQDGLDVRSDLGGLNLSDVPKVFIETGNMRNATDAALLTSSTFRQREARALAAGLSRFLKEG